MCLIDVLNLREINLWKDSFPWFKNFFKSEGVEKCRLFLGVYISCTTNQISFEFKMQGHEYVEHKMCKFEENWISIVLDIQGVEISYFYLL